MNKEQIRSKIRSYIIDNGIPVIDVLKFLNKRGLQLDYKPYDMEDINSVMVEEGISHLELLKMIQNSDYFNIDDDYFLLDLDTKSIVSYNDLEYHINLFDNLDVLVYTLVNDVLGDDI